MLKREPTKLMDVESVLTRSETVHLCHDQNLAAFFLNKLSVAADTRSAIWVQNAHGVVSLLLCTLDHFRFSLSTTNLYIFKIKRANSYLD